MSRKSQAKAIIDANIKRNGRQEITGPILNGVLNAVLDAPVIDIIQDGQMLPKDADGNVVIPPSSAVGAVRYDVEQILTEVEKELARRNIGASSSADIESAVSAERQRAEGVESGLRSDLTAEVQRAEGAESALQSSLEAEVQRATTEELRIAGLIGAMYTNAQIDAFLAPKMERVELAMIASQTPLKITYKGQSRALTFEEIKALVQNTAKFVTLLVDDAYFLIPSLDYYDDAVQFVGTNILTGQAEAVRVMINSSNLVSCYAIELECSDHKVSSMENVTPADQYIKYPNVKAVIDYVAAHSGGGNIVELPMISRRSTQEELAEFYTKIKDNADKNVVFCINSDADGLWKVISTSVVVDENEVYVLFLSDGYIEISVKYENGTYSPSLNSIVFEQESNKVTSIDSSSPSAYRYTSEKAVVDYVAAHGGIPDAPIDGKKYARKDGAWSEIAEGSQIVNLPFISEYSSADMLKAFMDSIKDNVGKDVIFAMDVAMMGASLNPYFVHYSNDEDEGEVAVAQFSPDPGYDQIIGVAYKDGVYSFIEESFESASVERVNSKQDQLISGENIKTINNQPILGSGNIEISGEDNVFLAHYGTTTWAEINEAAGNGKLIHAEYNGRLYNLETALPVESGAIIFYTIQAANSMRLSVVQPNTWSNSSYALQQAQNRKSTIDPTSTTDYPNSKAVADYVAEQIGNINSILETI